MFSFFKKEINQDIIVSMTCIPSRIHLVEKSIRSILNQSIQPYKIILYLCKDDYFGNNAIKPEKVPKKLYKYSNKGLISIRWVKNIGPYTKLIPAIRDFPRKSIVTADDDTIYPKKWLEKLLDKHHQNKNAIICYRGSRMILNSGGFERYNSWPEYKNNQDSLLLFFKGKDGVLYPPNSLDLEVFNEKKFKQLSPFADDIWFNAMAIKNDTKKIKVKDSHVDFKLIKGSFQVTLSSLNVDQMKNDIYLNNVFKNYNLFKKLTSDC